MTVDNKGKRDWKNHKYLAKIKTKSGKVRYIYKDRKTSSNGAQLIREKEGNRDNTLKGNYSEEKIAKENLKIWNDEIDRQNKLTRDEKNQFGNVKTNNYRKTSEKERKERNAELDRKQKLTRDERKLQNADSRIRGKKTGTGQVQNGSNGKRDDRIKRDEVSENTRRGNYRDAVNPNSSSSNNERIKRDEVSEDTRRGEHRAAVNTNSSGASYTNNYVKQYGNTLVSEL